MKSLILIVEDEPAQAEALRYNLDKAGFYTIVAKTGTDAIIAIEERRPDLAIVDWMLPERSGIEVCRHIRNNRNTRSLPIIMLTARGEESDKVMGLDAGADDYVVKPYSPREIVARAQALLRRANIDDGRGTLEYAGVAIDTDTHKVTRDGIPVHLGPTEFQILKTMIDRPGRVYSRDALLDKVWGRDINVEERTVDVHIRRLRKALNSGDKTDLIRTVRGAGYAIDAEE